MFEPAQRVEEILRRTGQRRDSVTAGLLARRHVREFSTIPGGRDRDRDYSSIDPANDHVTPRPRHARATTPTGTPITPGTEPTYNGQTDPAVTVGVEIEPRLQPDQPRQAGDLKVADAKRNNDKYRDESLGLEKLAGKIAAKLGLHDPTEAIKEAREIVKKWREKNQLANLDEVTADDDRVSRMAHHKEKHLFTAAHGSHTPKGKPDQHAVLDPKVAPKGPTMGHA